MIAETSKQSLAQAPYDPPIGRGRFIWPEIDSPDPKQAAWNSAVRQEVLRGSMNVADKDVQVWYRVNAANARFINLQIQVSEYGYGAAHPNGGIFAFEWWLDRKRPLRAEDVFRSNGGWQRFLAERCFEKLTTGDSAQRLYPNTDNRPAIAENVTKVDQWFLDADKLRIEFSVYLIGPYAAGSFEVDLSWDELRSYLASGFDPAKLPAQLEKAQ